MRCTALLPAKNYVVRGDLKVMEVIEHIGAHHHELRMWGHHRLRLQCEEPRAHPKRALLLEPQEVLADHRGNVGGQAADQAVDHAKEGTGDREPHGVKLPFANYLLEHQLQERLADTPDQQACLDLGWIDYRCRGLHSCCEDLQGSQLVVKGWKDH